MHNTSQLVLAVLLPLLVWTGTLGAQTTSGVISGRVVDPGGLGIPGAALTLSNDATREERQAVSVETGDFVFPAVLPGRYTVTVQSPGMKRLEKTNLNITASERLSVGDLQLAIGSITESVTVASQGTPVQTQSQER